MTGITNHHRATWAAAGLLAYCEAREGAYEPYDEAEYILSDLLTDLMHYAAREGIDFMRCMERAEIHHRAEQQEEAASPPAQPDGSTAADTCSRPVARPCALIRLIDTIDATGGLVMLEDDRLYPAADEDWADLADAYLAACTETGRVPRIGEDDNPEARGTKP